MYELIYWNEGRPSIEDNYLIQDNEGNVDISYYYTNGDIFRYEMEADVGISVVRYAKIPRGK